MTGHTAGIDISKAHLDAHAAPEGTAARFSNDATGFRKLIAWIGPETDRVAYEPTGPWHRDFEEALLGAGVPLYAINPYQVRWFARSRGRRAKTDAVVARTLAQMAAAVDDLRPTRAMSRARRDLAELQLVRDALVADRTATLNRGRHLRHDLSRRVNDERLAQIENQLKRVDGEIHKLLGSEEKLRRTSEILTSIPGVSSVTAAGLIVHMPKLGTLSGPRAASLAGLAPRDSGVRQLEGARLHPGGQGEGAVGAPHAGAGRHPLESRAEAEVPGAPGRRQAAQGRPHCRHAEARRPCQRPRAAGSPLDPRAPGGGLTWRARPAPTRPRARTCGPTKASLATWIFNS